MPRLLTTTVPKYCHHKASGQAVVCLDGRDFYLGEFTDPASKAAYNRLVGEWQANGRRLPPQLSHALATVDELILGYMRHADSYYLKNGEPTSMIHCIRSALKPLTRLYGTTHAADFGPLSLKAVREEMIKLKWSRRTVNTQVGVIKAMFKWAVENELVPLSTFHGLQAVAGLRRGRSAARETRPVKPVSLQDVEAIRAHVSEQVWAMIQLQLLTGMRPGEVVTMRPMDIEQGEKGWEYRPAIHKTEHHDFDRIIYLGEKCRELLKPYVNRDPSLPLFSAAEAEEQRSRERRRDRRSPMTPSQARRKPKAKPRRTAGNCYDVDSYRRAVHRACTQAGIAKWTVHQLRHTAATRLRKEYGIEIARVVLGHRSAEVTEIYAELDRTKAAEIMRQVG